MQFRPISFFKRAITPIDLSGGFWVNITPGKMVLSQ
jgi:hypothetical protein